MHSGIQVLLENGAEVDVRDLRGWTPLARATRYGRAEVVQVRFQNHHNFLSPL